MRSPDAEGLAFFPDGSPESLRGTDLSRGKRVRVAVWLAREEDRRADGVYAAHVQIEGHPDYDPPRPVYADTSFQASELAFKVVRDHLAAHAAYPVPPDALPQ